MKKLISSKSKVPKRLFMKNPERNYEKDAWFYVAEEGVEFIHWVDGNCYCFLIPWNKLIK